MISQFRKMEVTFSEIFEVFCELEREIRSQEMFQYDAICWPQVFFLTNKADALYGSKMVTSRVKIG